MKILRPTHGHKGDSFREILKIWESKGLCTIGDSPDEFCWIGSQGEVLLYDYPRIDDRKISPFRFGLFGNTVPNNPNCSPWVFWPRKPMLVEKNKFRFRRSYGERRYKSIFLGKIENQIQLYNRTRADWSGAVELFRMPVMMGNSDHWPYTPEEYLEKLSYSKFGLCLPGYGPKCNREIEYMALGVVPIVTPGVDLTYYQPLKENVHYVRLTRPQEIDKLDRITAERWKILSNNCVKWYEGCCSPEGSFAVTLKITNEVMNVDSK